MGSCLQSVSHVFSSNMLFSQASQLGVYKAFVDNYKEALETAEKCSHANIQFQKISEVTPNTHQPDLLYQWGRVGLSFVCHAEKGFD